MLRTLFIITHIVVSMHKFSVLSKYKNKSRYENLWFSFYGMVPGAGLEPAWTFVPWILSPLRLPFRHPGNNLVKHIMQYIKLNVNTCLNFLLKKNII